MAKNVYYFDSKILSFTQRKKRFSEKIVKFLAYFLVCLSFAFLINQFYIFHILAPAEKNLQVQMERLYNKYLSLQVQITKIDSTLVKIQYWDDHIYRAVLDMKPIPQSIRSVGTGGSVLVSEYFENMDQIDLVSQTTHNLEYVKSKLLVQVKSFEEVLKAAYFKEEYYQCKPAIMPISPKNYTYISSYFGYRIDPYSGSIRRHQGMDFPAMRGSPVHSSGKGKVSLVQRSRRGYGNEVLIDHGFGLTTRYAHLHKIHVVEGQKVSRGGLIGEVGSTGKSTGPHLHYEVRINNVPVNPKYYFNFDLSVNDYEKIVTLALKNE